MENNDNLNVQKLLYENAMKSSDAQDARKNNIDNKVNYLLTLSIVLLGIIIEFVNINELFSIEGWQNDIKLICSIVIITLIYCCSIAVAFIIVIRYIKILTGKKYRLIKADHFLDKDVEQMNEKELLRRLTEEYVENSINNAKANDWQMNYYDFTTKMLYVELVLVGLIYLVLKFFI